MPEHFSESFAYYSGLRQKKNSCRCWGSDRKSGWKKHPQKKICGCFFVCMYILVV